MSASDRTRRTLEDFLEFADAAARLVARGKGDYGDDEMIRLAAEALLHNVGEVVARLDRDDPELVAAHPEVSWRPMKGMRNLVAHDGAVDLRSSGPGWRRISPERRSRFDASSTPSHRTADGPTSAPDEPARVSDDSDRGAIQSPRRGGSTKVTLMSRALNMPINMARVFSSARSASSESFAPAAIFCSASL